MRALLQPLVATDGAAYRCTYITEVCYELMLQHVWDTSEAGEAKTLTARLMVKAEHSAEVFIKCSEFSATRYVMIYIVSSHRVVSKTVFDDT